MSLNRIVWLGFGMVLSFVSCERENITPYIGQRYVKAPADLAVGSFNVPADPVDFQTESAGITADLSHEVSWSLTLTGSQSKAVKTYNGISNSVNVSWKGSHDQLYFFLAGEDVYATLSFIGNNMVVRDTIRISKEKIYDGFYLFNEFSNHLNGSDINWTDIYFGQSGFTAVPSLSNKVEGKASYYLAGSDVNSTYFVGGIRNQTDAPGIKQWFEFPTYNPDSIFFNVFVYGTGNDATMGAISVGEDEDMDGTYEDAKLHSEDTWDFQFKVNWKGWKLVSAPYSAFQKSTSPVYGGTGNGRREADKMRQITFNLLSSPPMHSVEIYYDFPIITFGKPFNPHE